MSLDIHEAILSHARRFGYSVSKESDTVWPIFGRIDMSDGPDEVDVLVVGAGPTGSALALDLKRRGVRVRLIDRADRAFEGSRAKGVQPRTQEVFDDLGVLEDAHSEGGDYPRAGIHLGPLVVPMQMQKRSRQTDDVPYPNILLLPQSRTDAVLHRALARFDAAPEFGLALDGFEQDDSGVTSHLSTGETVRSRYLVGADGGGSTVRRGVGISFAGSTKAEDRTLIVDATVDGLSRTYWHMWPRSKGRGVGACPLPHGDQFQIMMRLSADEEVDLGEDALSARFRSLTGHTLRDVTWTSVFRPNVRLVERYRSNRVFLAGDAAHVHTPAGAQGLNTGVQDAYNLGWKLGQVIAGAPGKLLDSYEAERRPIAAHVLGRSSELYEGIERGGVGGLRRGDEERQLSLTYRGGPLATVDAPSTSTLRVGDRAPDASCVGASIRHLFDAFRGPHFTLLVFGSVARADLAEVRWPSAGAELRTFAVLESGDAADEGVLIDEAGTLRARYGITGDTIVLVRPDGYIGAIGTSRWAAVLESAKSGLSPVK
jgi:2-polyprenyl-6-methoxyphenol hydroxylase-like FAD-dependent oxidoreductase